MVVVHPPASPPLPPLSLPPLPPPLPLFLSIHFPSLSFDRSQILHHQLQQKRKEGKTEPRIIVGKNTVDAFHTELVCMPRSLNLPVRVTLYL